jgi:catechol 2,3-dioxygenase-like lactoylglutathione lyase family enzyme
MPIRIKDIDHVVLRVKDMERAVGFYCDVLGCSVDRERDDLGLYHLRAGSAFIDLVDIKGKLGREGGGAARIKGRNMDHLALRLEIFDERSIRAYLQSHGIEAGEAVERYGAEGDGPSFYIKDPDGNTIELKGPPTS